MILPVSFLSFTGKINQKGEAILNWKLTQQQNMNGFEIERSTDGQSYQKIGFVKVSSEAINSEYNFVDKSPLAGLNYYRLKIIDQDGKFRYSTIVSVNR